MHPVNPSPLRFPIQVILALSTLLLAAGCHDGPMYGLKVANPYYSLREWQADEELGPTDHLRRGELNKLVAVMASLPEEKQAVWFTHLRGILDHDASPEMRRLAILAAGRSKLPDSAELIQRGLKDDSLKVRLASCRVLGDRTDPESTRLLAETAGSTSDVDVRNAALAALANHRSPIAVDALKLALDTRDPATRSLALESLRGATGKDYGDDPQVWIAALEGKEPTAEPPTRLADRLPNFLRLR
jgi:hypothetical protein